MKNKINDFEFYIKKAMLKKYPNLKIKGYKQLSGKQEIGDNILIKWINISFDAKIITIGYDVWHPYCGYFNIAEIEFKELIIQDLKEPKNEKK